MYLINGDCVEEIKKLPENSVDSVCCDPPYELGFMGKSWDNTGIANNKDMWAECLRVLKPGGHLLAFSGTRTYHRMACAIEDAGFEVRDMIEWVYGSGFPKSLNIGKVTDKFLKTGNASWNGTGDSSNGALGYSKLQHKQDYRPEDYSNRHQNKDKITEEQAKQWEGWGTALKPAHEPICMARKPLAEKTVAENVLKYGTGGINIDESRVEAQGKDLDKLNSEWDREWNTNYSDYADKVGGSAGFNMDKAKKENAGLSGRFPANLIHDNSEEVRECFPETKSPKQYEYSGTKDREQSVVKGFGAGYGVGHENEYGDSGNASRFFKSIIYQAKASKSERNKGCDKNNHPTVKPIALMEYLIKMVTPKGGVVLDPFMGSGSTGVAAKIAGRDFVGIELDPNYFKIAEKRIAAA